MKRVVLFIAMTCCVSSMALGGGIGAFGSYWSTKDADSGYGYGVRLASTSDPAGYLEVRLSRFEDLNEDKSLMDGELEVMPIDVGITLKMGAEDSIDFYLGGGGSYFLMDSETEVDGGMRETDIDDEWGWYGLFGFEMALTDSLTLFGEGIYRQVEGTLHGDDIDDASSDVDIKLDGFGGNAGIMLMF